MIVNSEIRIGEQVLDKDQGVAVTLFDASHPHPYPHWGENSGLFYALANMKGRVSIGEGSPAETALRQAQAKLKQEAGRVDGNYVNVLVFITALPHSLILHDQNWFFDRETATWTYDLF